MNRDWKRPLRRIVLALGVTVAVGAVTAPALADSSAEPPKYPVFLYVDTVAGTRPASGVKPRPVGCSQSNYFVRGEQVVWRIWGSEAATGDILSAENVKYAYVKVPGQPNMRLNWGAHGATSNRVWFWTAAWVIPKDYPLGTARTQIVFKTEANTFGRFDYDLQIVPNLGAKKKK
jgi:hypothetical protein